MILPMEHRTPSGLEIRMYPKEAKRAFGFKLDRNEKDETEDELKARFARVLAETDFEAIVRVYQLKEQQPPAPAPVAKAKPRKKASPPVLQLGAKQEMPPLPKFLTEPK